ncbi:MAG TPA: phosphoesterase [Terriglobia bacterium]|nr:phosphoesterase [Terriglobia bacterium]
MKTSQGRMRAWIPVLLTAGLIASLAGVWRDRAATTWAQEKSAPREISLSSSKMLITPAPGDPQRSNSFPTAAVVSPDGRYLAILNNGYGTAESGYNQSIAVLDLETNQLSDYPDARLARRGHQTYFLGLAFSPGGHHLYASIASITDYNGIEPGDTGNGIAVYSFDGGRIAPEHFIKIPLQPLKANQKTKVNRLLPAGMAIPYPAGLAVTGEEGHERLLVADDLSDDVLLLDATSGETIHRCDISTHDDVPASYPYAVAATRDGKRAWVSLWNASEVDELDLGAGTVARRIPLLPPTEPTRPGSHPTALLLGPGEDRLYVTLANADRVAAVNTATGQLTALLSTQFPGEKYYGTFPNALAQNAAGDRLYVADASANSVAVFDVAHLDSSSSGIAVSALGFIPTEWYPTALAVQGGDLFVVTGKGQGPGPNSTVLPPQPGQQSTRPNHPYIPTLIHGSVARLNVQKAQSELSELTRQAVESNRMQNQPAPIRFASGKSPIEHVIYIIKENRTFDQILGDMKEANGDPSLVMYGEDITPNQHALARQFGILDNFYTSGEVSGNGHVWSTAAITSDYTEKTWEISYRGGERLYDYEGEVENAYPLQQGIPDVNEPATGYLWGDVARAGLTYRHYGEFVATEWCNDTEPGQSPAAGTPHPQGEDCAKPFIRPGDPLPPNLGQPQGAPNPWPWPVPVIARDVPTKPELVGHFDPRFPDFNLLYPDQLRVDEFLNEFNGFVEARKQGQKSGEMPQYVLLRLPNDHTMGTRPGGPKPEASVADNDLAVGRVAEAISKSPYWDDTAIFVLEDDAQDGADHVDSHRSPALVISRYAPGSAARPFVDHSFYTTVNVVRTMEVLLGLPPMNNNDAWAQPMAEMFSGPPTQQPFTADDRNLKNGLLYQMNPPRAPGGKASARMDFSHADAVNTAELNRILWRERKGNTPMPPPKHTVFPASEGDGD